MKRIFTLLIAICIMTCSLGIDTFASDLNSGISPMNLYTEGISVSTTKTNSGIFYNCRVDGNSSATKIKIYLYLQEYRNGSWQGVDAVSTTVNGRSAYVSDTYTSPVLNRKYRAEAHVYTYSGSNYEYLEARSVTIIYKG